MSPIPNGVYVSGQPFTVEDSFTEPGIADEDTVTINWGDGMTTTTLDDATTYTNPQGDVVNNIVEPTATTPGSVTFGLVYNDSSPHTIEVTITDKDGGSDSVYATFVTQYTTATTVTSSAPAIPQSTVSR